MKRTVFPPVAGDNQSKYGTTMFPPFVDETASIAYDGTLLPAGTGVDPTKRYLKDLGKDKNHVLVESGQGKFFNGSNQYINTGIIPNQAEGTLVTRFTYTSGVDRIVVGQSGGTANFMIGVNSQGKIYGRLGAVSNIATSWSPVAGKSYHIALRYSGGIAELIVDKISIGTFTIDASLPVVSLSLGARNTATTASLYWNSVIDETYYYDVALPDTAIQSLYQYPEKIKAYNGAIVPDIGYEANCKLFLPLCESNNTIQNVANIAVAPSVNILTNGNFSDGATGWSLQTVDANNYTEVVGGAGHVVSNGTLVALQTNTSVCLSGKSYKVEFDVTSITGTGYCQVDTTQYVFTTTGKHTVYTPKLANSFSCIFKRGAACNFTFDNVTVQEVSSFAIANFTASCVDSAKQLSYGAQCIAWKRDALGLPTGMASKMQYDGYKSTKPTNTNWVPTAGEDFILETIMYFKNEARFESQGTYVSSTDRITIGKNSADNRARFMINANNLYSNTFYDVLGYRHIIIKKLGNVWEMVVDGISCGTTTVAITNVTAMRFGGTNSSSYYCLNPIRSFKRHSVTADPVKLYNKAKRKLYQDVIPANIVLVGDSTVTDSLGWGLQFKNYVKPEYSVINKAYSGESSKSFYDKGLWELAKRYGANYYLIQFGHNDSKTDPIYTTDAQTTYKDYLRLYVNEARSIGGTPILVTSMLRANFTDGQVNLPDTRNYAEAMVEVATEMNVPCILLNWKSEVKYEELGEVAIHAMQPADDTTHWLTTGGDMLSQLIHEEMVRLNLPIAN